MLHVTSVKHPAGFCGTACSSTHAAQCVVLVQVPTTCACMRICLFGMWYVMLHYSSHLCALLGVSVRSKAPGQRHPNVAESAPHVRSARMQSIGGFTVHAYKLCELACGAERIGMPWGVCWIARLVRGKGRLCCCEGTPSRSGCMQLQRRHGEVVLHYA